MKVLTILAAALFVAAPAIAGRGEKGDWEFGPYAGFGVLDDYGDLNPDNGPIYGGRVGYFFSPHWSLEGSFQRLTSEIDLGSSLGDVDLDIDSIRLNVLYNFRSGESFRPFVTAGLGSEKADVEDFGDSKDIGFNAGGGLRWYFTDHFGLRVDGRYVSVDVGEEEVDQRQSNLEGTVGLLWSFGGGPPADSDRDGVPDRKDKCPNTPTGAKVDANGCNIDSDGDGVPDGIDQCPNTPKGWPVDERGCPKDSDGDGVFDKEDACPNTPKGAKVDATGCPMDSDDDGVVDGLDRCPNTPKGAKVDAYGCPLDGDHDGVFDGLDKCPDSKPRVKVDADGCEIVEKAPQLFAPEKKSLVLEGVNFETNKADILPESAAILDKVAASLKDWPDVKVEIGGHTDSSGSDAHNLDLSQRRADSVKAYFMARGIDASRLTAKGYGEKKPIADNKTAEGKAKNRRVELTKVD
ncbi:MAG TPA: OmpA family protein [Candidatus Polarisedimenticolia bacterium]|nr:OmpA family protein [Candidatus Polarisedimenticolia bacterium]